MGVAAYYRVSMARDGMSAPELYTDEITRYCKYKGLALDNIFSDIDYSGYNNSEKRPGLRELVRRRHEFDSIIVPKLSRFGRSLKHLSELFSIFDTEGIPLVFLDLGMDTTTSQGRLLRNIMSSFAEFESDVKADYARANHRLRALAGKIPGGRAPTGYRKVGDTFEFDEPNASTIRLVFEMYRAGASQRHIATEFTAKGLRRIGGGRWRGNLVGMVLDNPSYAGFRLVDDDLVQGNWPPLIDPDIWKEVADMRRLRPLQVPRQRGTKKVLSLLGGLIKCDRCGGAAWYKPSPGGTRGRYTCKNRTPFDKPATCDMPGIASTKAEHIVVSAFLARAQLQLLESPDGSIFVAADQWDRTHLAGRRELLKAAVERVVIVEGESGMGIRIDWKPKPTVVQEAQPASLHKPDSVSERFRAREVRLPERVEALRLERIRSARDDWNAALERIRRSNEGRFSPPP